MTDEGQWQLQIDAVALVMELILTEFWLLNQIFRGNSISWWSIFFGTIASKIGVRKF
jgi:hypothetical protein